MIQRIYKQGFMWVAQDSKGRTAWGKSREEAVANMDEFLRQEKLFNEQHS